MSNQRQCLPFGTYDSDIGITAVQCVRQFAAEAVQGLVEKREEAVEPGCTMRCSFRATCRHRMLSKEIMVASLPITHLLPAWMMVQLGPYKAT